ncbi:MAG TPA: NAD-dependent epimerase/dehydratase family protein [Gemmatimonadaceae bacterium]|nr:NAD-dependent epimerase/dehydratase family protein [Gemmatimonadaceae bacterium]
MRALITGAAGFVAPHLTAMVRSSGGDCVVGIDLRPMQVDLFDECRILDLTDMAATMHALASVQPGAVYHLAGAVRGTADAIHASNVGTTANLLTALRTVAPEAVLVLVGSAAEYGVVPAPLQPVAESFEGTPVSSYGVAKAEVSALALRAAMQGQRVVVVRPFNVLGSGVPDALVGGAIVHRLRAALAAAPPRTIRIGRTTAVRDFVAVEDVARGMVQAAELGRPGEAYNLCSGEGHSVAELLTRLLALAGEAVAVDEDPTLFRADDIDALIGSRDKAKNELSWEPTVSFDETVRSAWEGSGQAESVRDA